MDTSSIGPQQKMLAASGALVLYAISLLFFPWYGAGPLSITGWDATPSSWIWLILALVAAGALAAQAFDYELPVNLPPLSVAAYCSSVVLIMTVAMLLEGAGGRKWGLFLAALCAIAGAVLSYMAWREEG